MSTPPCVSRSSLRPASELRQRTPQPRATPNHGTKESNARPHAFPPTAIVAHPRRGFSAQPARFRRTFCAEARSPFWSQSTRPSWRRQERSRPAAAAQTLPLRFADSSPQASCGPSPPKTLLGTWEFTAPHVRSGRMSRPTRDHIQKENIRSSYRNNVHLEGNLGKDAEKNSTPDGDGCNFSIAVNEPVERQGRYRAQEH
jgi:hypothetical protein